MAGEIDQLVTLAISKAWPIYRRIIADKLDGKAVDWSELTAPLVRAIVLANLMGRESSANEAIAAGADLHIDGEPVSAPETYATQIPSKILSRPLVDAANEFRKTVPGLSTIFSDLLRFGESQAFLISGIEDHNALRDVGQVIADMLHDREADVSRIEMGRFFEETEEALQLARWRLENVFRTSVMSAVEAGKWAQDQDPLIRSITPFYRISTADDAAVRPHHVVFHGAAWPSGDPIWQQMRPPFSFQCRCSRDSVTTPEAERLGWLSLKGELTGKHRGTWSRAIAAGLLNPDGTLTGRRVKLLGRWDTFPHEGFYQGAAA